jgi:hypothetical protein
MNRANAAFCRLANALAGIRNFLITSRRRKPYILMTGLRNEAIPDAVRPYGINV